MVRGYFSRIEADRKRLEKLKSDETQYKKFLEKRKQYNDKEKAKKYREEMREISIQLGNCLRCGQPKKRDKYKYCEDCREKGKIIYQNRKDRLKKMRDKKKKEKLNNGK
jgi:hypothetical protein